MSGAKALPMCRFTVCWVNFNEHSNASVTSRMTMQLEHVSRWNTFPVPVRFFDVQIRRVPLVGSMLHRKPQMEDCHSHCGCAV